MTVARLHPTDTSSETWEAETHGAPPLKVENWRLRAYIRNLRGVRAADKALLYTLAEHRNQETCKCCPGYALLSEEVGCSEDSLTKSVARMMGKRIIGRVQGTGTNGVTSRYWFVFDKAAMLALYDGDVRAMFDAWGVPADCG